MAYQDVYGALQVLGSGVLRERKIAVTINCDEFDLFVESDPYDYLYDHLYDPLSEGDRPKHN